MILLISIPFCGFDEPQHTIVVHYRKATDLEWIMFLILLVQHGVFSAIISVHRYHAATFKGAILKEIRAYVFLRDRSVATFVG